LWSNWGFGLEALADSAARLERAGIAWIELHGNHYGPDLGYQPKETLKILCDHGVKVGGVCGMFSKDNDLASNRAVHRQAALDYLKRELAFTQAVGGSYMLVVPGAVRMWGTYDPSIRVFKETCTDSNKSVNGADATEGNVEVKWTRPTRGRGPSLTT
jgi:D-psicose/D-tagatose/L-ribulose 3-epimerase